MTNGEETGRVAVLRRYPVKSMLGERCTSLDVGATGVIGDRRYALIDDESGRVVTAKNPRLWRRLLECTAATADDGVVVTLPDGATMPVSDAGAALSELVGRSVHVADERSAGAVLERPDPEDVLARGLDAETEIVLLELAQGAPGGAFVDHSPVHLVATSTLDAIGFDLDESVRYRPNLVIETRDGTPPFVENDWVGATLRLGEVVLRGTLPTPRCSVPTLEHGTLPRSPHSVRYPQEHNRVEAGEFGVLPCAGLYAEVVTGGTVREGDRMRVG
ncbi:molybdenum cofactor biosysynthesis protein [Mycolicibacterium duvalii]|uniref:Molybdenum cofactor biosysynthesis protein n=1 Tax=Mycolicibacterium duvalii TaxID=39688 RepID=A0A7I7K7R2_9MYCO|nr:MOSC N-terminal beta barrel domain-containing protein [Mycolicibacterium duvalii]MCV7366120.1 MOSC N-terminal beta barrel domain-containing protein [Mycolicibacterium duvalii]PEG40048.1 molybdenum cofactor biosysynthesis protein [Mycolicibacterium duvalii]BBX19568.1 molybdenum cofactor biosysynthesis protein [Mycolicibacterium duvalii]